MIRLLRIDGLEILLNADQIHTISSHPDGGTKIRLLDGEELRVKNHHADITTKVEAWILGRRKEEIPGDFLPLKPTPKKR
ncbi:MAG TPA: hypothetical protein ENN40_05685 [Candidatus Aminicenantes bacterium]|nr:hypothetical protein [Candidatus Aminicenantes bacterium]